jgi:hypothetical protein
MSPSKIHCRCRYPPPVWGTFRFLFPSPRCCITQRCRWRRHFAAVQSDAFVAIAESSEKFTRLSRELLVVSFGPKQSVVSADDTVVTRPIAILTQRWTPLVDRTEVVTEQLHG